jgi:hypothetical protein
MDYKGLLWIKTWPASLKKTEGHHYRSNKKEVPV